MAVKTITIDLEAYGLLAVRKRDGQSFSQVIKAHFAPQPTAGRFLDRVRGIRPGADALDAMSAIVQARRRDGARAVAR
jgi:predicted CopG family antitoxin